MKIKRFMVTSEKYDMAYKGQIMSVLPNTPLPLARLMHPVPIIWNDGEISPRPRSTEQALPPNHLSSMVKFALLGLSLKPAGTTNTQIWYDLSEYSHNAVSLIPRIKEKLAADSIFEVGDVYTTKNSIKEHVKLFASEYGDFLVGGITGPKEDVLLFSCDPTDVKSYIKISIATANNEHPVIGISLAVIYHKIKGE